MDFKDQVTKWVENKVGKVISKDLKEKVVEENSSFDIESYANILLDEHFGGNYIEQLKEIFNQGSYGDLIYSDFEYLSEKQNGLNDSVELDLTEFKTLFEDEIIENLQSNSREVKKKSLKILEASLEDFINQTSWEVIIQRLQKTLTARDREINNLVLKIFHKLLRYSKKPEAVCNGFKCTAKLIAKQIVSFNLENEMPSVERNYDLKEGTRHIIHNLESNYNYWNLGANLEVLIKLMWLLVDCQQQMPVKCLRFNESRFREIIFSFVHLLSSTTITENKELSGLEILSILNPTASWCRYYCHTAVGRSLLCSALKKYKTFFTHIVEIILNRIKIKKFKSLPRTGDGTLLNKNSEKFMYGVQEVLKPIHSISKINCVAEKSESLLKEKHLDERNNWICSAPVEQCEAKSSEDRKLKKSNNSSSNWALNFIPRKVVAEAVFYHSVSLVTWLIQFRSGQALFPVHTKMKKRFLSLQDFSLYITDYLENVEYYERETAGITFTSNYKGKLHEIVGILKSVKNCRNPRSVDKQTFSNL